MSSGKRSKLSKRRRDKSRHAGRPAELAGVRPDKKLGQNFLIDEDIISRIIEGSGVTKDSFVIEIGPGTGALTLPLAEKAGRLTAVELDPDMIEGLRIKTFGMDNVTILHQDILETDIRGLCAEAFREHSLKDLKIIGNLPYYITTPIIMKLLEELAGFGAEVSTGITVMMQKEVGDRIAAEPGTRASGAITYPVHYYAEVSELTDVPRECFFPVPGVDSVVLRLDLREEPPVSVKSEQMLFDCVNAGFAMIINTILNALSRLGGYEKNQLSAALDLAGIDPGRRAETLSLAEFARLADSIQEA